MRPFVPLTITAELASPPMVVGPLLLDAILYFATGCRLGSAHPSGRVEREEVDAVDLPLLRIESGAGWWWAASQATPHGFEEAVHTHKRAPLHQAVLLTAAKSVNVAAGPDKSLRKRRYTRPEMTHIRWMCIGDPDEVRALLRYVPAVGAQTTHGHGWVVKWSVEDGGPDDLAYATDVSLRHIPVDVLPSLPRSCTVRSMSLRPPYWDRSELVRCAQVPHVAWGAP